MFKGPLLAPCRTEDGSPSAQRAARKGACKQIGSRTRYRIRDTQSLDRSRTLSDPDRGPLHALRARASGKTLCARGAAGLIFAATVARAARDSRMASLREIEVTKAALGYRSIAGVDEAGRGPLVGSVVAAACVVPPGVEIEGVNDSKTLTEEKREAIYEEIMKRTQVGVGIVDEKTIDEINILQATMLAMEKAVANLPSAPDLVLIDGNRVPAGLNDAKGLTAEALVKGDARCFCIAAASIVAKVTRDRMMVELDKAHPQYGFKQHKGYPTAAHVSALHKLGPLDEHRMSFGPVARAAQAAAAREGRAAPEVKMSARAAAKSRAKESPRATRPAVKRHAGTEKPAAEKLPTGSAHASNKRKPPGGPAGTITEVGNGRVTRSRGNGLA